MRKNTAADVFAKVSIDPITGCGIWSGVHDKDGYPLIKWSGKTVRVTRLIWTLKYGQIPAGLQVLHSCDNSKCPNDAHFFLGTSIENRADCVAKGRQAKGKKSGRYTKPERTARGVRHGSKTKPESVPRGEQHPHYGKPARVPRDDATGQFKAISPLHQ